MKVIIIEPFYLYIMCDFTMLNNIKITNRIVVAYLVPSY